MLRLCICAAALAAAGGASAASTASKPDADSYRGGTNWGAPYIEQVGSECMMVNVYLEQRDGVSEQVILREPVECSSTYGLDLAVADLTH
ncbi:hypothetical protein ACFOPN_08780 [Xanthomonas hyacinthi]|uniref:hypothetical protein n=1 Tax=Xanthomonas hyacinthi TaxID=56455 RepID=UPI0036134DA4